MLGKLIALLCMHSWLVSAQECNLTAADLLFNQCFKNPKLPTLSVCEKSDAASSCFANALIGSECYFIRNLNDSMKANFDQLERSPICSESCNTDVLFKTRDHAEDFLLRRHLDLNDEICSQFLLGSKRSLRLSGCMNVHEDVAAATLRIELLLAKLPKPPPEKCRVDKSLTSPMVLPQYSLYLHSCLIYFIQSSDRINIDQFCKVWPKTVESCSNQGIDTVKADKHLSVKVQPYVAELAKMCKPNRNCAFNKKDVADSLECLVQVGHAFINRASVQEILVDKFEGDVLLYKSLGILSNCAVRKPSNCTEFTHKIADELKKLFTSVYQIQNAGGANAPGGGTTAKPGTANKESTEIKNLKSLFPNVLQLGACCSAYLLSTREEKKCCMTSKFEACVKAASANQKGLLFGIDTNAVAKGCSNNKCEEEQCTSPSIDYKGCQDVINGANKKITGRDQYCRYVSSINKCLGQSYVKAKCEYAPFFIKTEEDTIQTIYHHRQTVAEDVQCSESAKQCSPTFAKINMLACLYNYVADKQRHCLKKMYIFDDCIRSSKFISGCDEGTPEVIDFESEVRKAWAYQHFYANGRCAL